MVMMMMVMWSLMSSDVGMDDKTVLTLSTFISGVVCRCCFCQARICLRLFAIHSCFLSGVCVLCVCVCVCVCVRSFFMFSFHLVVLDGMVNSTSMSKTYMFFCSIEGTA